jgi:putative nucleotidyltransferase with HDIG domain
MMIADSSSAMPKSVFHLSDGAAVTSSTPEERVKQDLEAFSVKDFLNDVREDLLANKIYLPTLPTVALEALLVVNDADSSAADLEKVIAKDAALTARLIRFANSPVYRGIDPVTSIKLAITRIGFQRVKNAVYAVSMKEVFRTPIRVIEQRMERLWTHSVKVGAMAAIMAKKQSRLDPDTALVAGLVHDIGYIPLLIKACEYQKLTENPDFLDRILFKMHSQVGSGIVKLWKFDPMIVAVTAEHEDLGRNPGGAPVDYVDLVQVANILAHKGTQHPLAKVDRNSVKAFARISLGGPEETSRLEEDSKTLEEIIF